MSQVNIENIDISQTLPVIACDYDGLKNWALAYVSRYKDLVITEDQVKEIKKDMAEINKAKQRIDKARIEAVKAVSAPIKAFEAKIKEICGIFEDAYNSLGNQVKDFEEAAREAKRAEIQTTIDRQIADFIGKHPDMDGKIAVLIPDKWLNKTCHIKDIGNEIDRLIREQYAAEQERQRIEKAQAERLLLIENAVNAANDKYALSMSVSAFMSAKYTDIDTDASIVLKAIEDTADVLKAEAEQQIIEDAKKPIKPENAPAPVMPTYDEMDVLIANKPLQPAQEQPQNLLMFRFTATFTPEQEAQVKEILNHNNFLKIKRRLDSIGIHTIVEQGNAEW